jgi:hypothetical protein
LRQLIASRWRCRGRLGTVHSIDTAETSETPQTQEPTMSRIAFNTRPVLNLVGELAMLGAMVGMTATGAAAWAWEPSPEPIRLETVVVTAKKPIVLPTVVVVAKRSNNS